MAEARIDARTMKSLPPTEGIHGPPRTGDGPLHDRSAHRAEDQNMVHKTNDE